MLDNLYIVFAQGEVGVNPFGESLEVLYHSNLINFILMLVFLVWLARKTQIFSALSRKRNTIIEQIRISESEEVNAENELADAKRQVARADEEVHKIVEEAKEIADSLAKRIHKEADIEANEVHNKAKRMIKAEYAMASNDVMQDVSKAAFYIAEEHIKQAIDERLHKKYIDEFIDDLDNLKV